MPYPIKKALRRSNLKSNDALAEKLLEEHGGDFLDGKGQKLSKRTLGTKIGELDRGMHAWWRKRETQTNHLLNALGMEREDLDLRPIGGQHRLSFASFPAYPPLTLPREIPWRIGQAQRNQDSHTSSRYGNKPTLDFWLSGKRRGLTPDGVQWLCVPDDVEFVLLTHWLIATGAYPVLRVATPDVVMRRHLDEVAWSDPQIIVLEHGGEAEHIGRLASLHQDAPLLIIVRDVLPAFASQDQRQDLAVARAAHAKIEQWTWTLLPDWRQQLVLAVEQRMLDLGVDNQFLSEVTLSLLERFDRSHQWFASVTDVLVLCQAVCEGEENGLREKINNATDAASLLSLLFNRNEAHLEQTRHVVKARWLRLALNWSGALTRDEWIDLVKSEERFETMITRNLLGQQGRDYRFQRPVVTRLLLRSYLVEQMNKVDLDSWAPACFDDERRPLVDAALDALSVEALQKLARKVGPACIDRRYLGAAEAVFAALGRRMLHDAINAHVLMEFAAHVLPKLRPHHDRVLPFSRSLSAPDEVAWTTVCWAWSVHVRPVPDETWLFPGSGERLPKLPDWLDNYGRKHAGYSWERIGPQLRDFLVIVRAWLVSRARRVDHALSAPLFRIALLAEAGVAKTTIDSSWWDGIIGDPWAEQALLECSLSAQGPKSELLALRWWPSLVRHRLKASDHRFGSSTIFTRHPIANGHSLVLVKIVECLSAQAAAAVEALGHEERLFLAQHATGLPPAFQRALLQSVAWDENPHWDSWQKSVLMAQLGPEVADELPALLDHPQLSRTAAARLWEWQPRKAEALLRTYRGQSRIGVRHLVLSSPSSAIGVALRVRERDPSLMNCEEWRDWALVRLSNAREHAAALLTLIEP